MLAQMPSSTSYQILFAILQAAVIVLLMIVLVQKEMLRAMGGNGGKQMKTLNVALVPLLALFVIIIGMRLTSFMF
jgi:hypothetical protein